MREPSTDTNEAFRHWDVEVLGEIRQEASRLRRVRQEMLRQWTRRKKSLRRKRKISEQEAAKIAAEEIQKANAEYYAAEQRLDFRRRERERQLRCLCEGVRIFPDGGELREVASCPSYVYSSQTDPLRYARESLVPLQKYLQQQGVTVELTVERDPLTGEIWEWSSGTARLLADCPPYMAKAAELRMTWPFMSQAWGFSVNPAVHIPGLSPEMLDEHWRRTGSRESEK